MALINKLREEAPPEPKKRQKRPKQEQAHVDLIETLEGRIEAIDTELAASSFVVMRWQAQLTQSLFPQRVARARKKVEQKYALYAQAELRETRTRRRAQKPDYVYDDGPDSEVSC